MEEQLITQEPIDSRGTIAEDLACGVCGYNLRSLKETALCPECGSRVTYSTREYYLRHAPARWVARLKWGMAILAAAFAFRPIRFSLEYAGAMCSPDASMGDPDAVRSLYLSFACVEGLLLLMLLAGLFLLFIPEPSRGQPRGQTSLRKAAMTLGVASVLASLVGAAPVLTGEHPSLPVAVAENTALWMAWLVLPVLVLFQISVLARRIPNRVAEAFARYMHVAFLSLCVGMPGWALVNAGLSLDGRITDVLVGAWFILLVISAFLLLAIVAAVSQGQEPAPAGKGAGGTLGQ